MQQGGARTSFGHFLLSWTRLRLSAVTACFSLYTDVIATTVFIQKGEKISLRRGLSQISHLIFKAHWAGANSEQAAKKILPSKRLKSLCYFTIAHLRSIRKLLESICFWVIFNSMRKLICLQSRFVYHSVMFDLLCHRLILSASHWRRTLKFGTTSCLVLYVWHYAGGINVIKRYQSQINFPLSPELSRIRVLRPDKLSWENVTLFSWVNWAHDDTGWWSNATFKRSSHEAWCVLPDL